MATWTNIEFRVCADYLLMKKYQHFYFLYMIANFPTNPRMLAVMYRFKSEQGWRRFDLSSPSRKDTNLQVGNRFRFAYCQID